jgi:ElaB/YqjD/DUF883 family membrane-anchored ribosome-binding protein
MMNDRQLEKKIRKDVTRVKKDISTLADDGVSHLSEGVEKLAGEVKETVVGVAATVKKDVGHRLSQYNTKAQEVADKVPGSFGKKVARYPWVAMSISMAVGFLLGVLLKPDRQPLR